MTRPLPFAALLRAFALLAIVAIAGCDGEFVDVEIDVGYRGEARYNCFLAAERFVRAMGRPARSVPWVGDFGSSTVVVPARAIPERSLAGKELVERVARGTHLIILGVQRDIATAREEFRRSVTDRLEEISEDAARRSDELRRSSRGSGRRWPWDDEDDEDDEEPWLRENWPSPPLAGDGKPHPFLEVFPVTVLSARDWGDSLPRGPRLDEAEPGSASYRWPAVGAAFALGFYYGEGRVTWLALEEPFRNESIGDDGHAELLWRVIASRDAPDVVFVHGERPGLFGLLWRSARLSVVSLLVLVGFWVWRRALRFGPLVAPSPRASAEFLRHVAGAGRFLWNTGHVEHLLDALRDDVRSAIVRTRPELLEREATRRAATTEDLQSDAILAALAGATGLDPERCRRALKLRTTEDRHRFFTVVDDLQRMRLSL